MDSQKKKWIAAGGVIFLAVALGIVLAVRAGGKKEIAPDSERAVLALADQGGISTPAGVSGGSLAPDSGQKESGSQTLSSSGENSPEATGAAVSSETGSDAVTSGGKGPTKEPDVLSGNADQKKGKGGSVKKGKTVQKKKSGSGRTSGSGKKNKSGKKKSGNSSGKKSGTSNGNSTGGTSGSGKKKTTADKNNSSSSRTKSEENTTGDSSSKNDDSQNSTSQKSDSGKKNEEKKSESKTVTVTVENGASSANTTEAVNGLHVYDRGDPDLEDITGTAKLKTGTEIELYVYPLASDVQLTVIHNGKTIVDKKIEKIEAFVDDDKVQFFKIKLEGDLTVTTKEL